MIELSPSFLDDFADTVMLLKEFQNNWDAETQIYLPVFGEPIALYPVSDPEA